MSELKTFKLGEKFSEVEDLYNYLQKNVATLENLTGIRIQKPLKEFPYCLIAKEKITERQILFFASKSEFPESLGELILLAGAFKADIVVFFVQKVTPTKLEPITWLHQNFYDDTQIILAEAEF